MKSMTGYGKGEAKNNDRVLTIELKAVNNRFLEINSRATKLFSFADDIVRKRIQERIKRGTVEVFFGYKAVGGSTKCVDADLALSESYLAAAKKIANKLKIKNDFSLVSLMKMPDILTISAAEENREEIEALFSLAAKNAVAELDKMREIEGEGIRSDLYGLVENIASALEKVKERAPTVTEDYTQKLRKRISELAGDIAIDESRLASEVAFFADRSDISEEISRLSSHIAQFISALDSTEAQGRRLDFLSQEMNREINTMGSKANDLTLTSIVIEMKNELEKIKEQIRNVE